MIVHNRIRCKICGDVIESEYTHDWKHCECGACSIDGGKAYLRRGGDKKNWEELSEIKENNKNESLG